MTEWRIPEDRLERIEFEREEDGRWIAEMPSIPGCMTYGSTKEEAICKVVRLAAEIELADNQTTPIAYPYDDDCWCPDGPPGSEPGWFCPFGHKTYRDDCWGCRY